MSKALLFPGQAAQFIGMGSTLSRHSEKARGILDTADDILGYRLSEIMHHGPEERLKETIYTQPAVFVHSYLVYQEHKKELDVNAVAGHSLGEITACVAAGVLGFEDGLKLVQARANAMQDACVSTPSTMAAILGMEDRVVEEICADIDDVVVPANYNCPGQLVISGSKTGIASAIEACKAAGARRALEIPVGGAFHSPIMEPAVEDFKIAIESMHFSDAEVAVYQNVDGLPHFDARQIKANLIQQITHPVLWTKTINNMIADGITHFVEVGGKGKVLMGMLRKISKEIDVELWKEEEK